MQLEDMILDIRRPAEDIWAFLTDWFNAPRDGSMLMLRQTSPGPTTLGSTLVGRRVILGMETRLDYVITEWDPPHTFAVSATSRPVPSVHARIRLDPTRDGTRLTVSSEIELLTVLKPLWPAYAILFNRRRRAQFQKFKELVESSITLTTDGGPDTG